MKDGSPATGEALDSGKPVSSSSFDRMGIARLHPICPTKGHDRFWDMEAENPADLATSRRRQGRMAHRHVHRRMIQVGVLDEHESLHTQEDKESTVTV